GDVRVCCDTWHIIGNVYKTNIREILESGERRKFQRKINCDDYSWCNPSCSDNPYPTRMALLDKYLYTARKNPGEFVQKVRNKLTKARSF
ncbi:MAG: SPASM domain-containing protein, partial [Candidatus Omnitrophica bacterium]|nr:SPASM domain-containing protein [Candidatus Omnitrophota bacterium]